MFILLAAAIALTPSQRLQRDFEDRARAELTDLFRALCPEQCVLLALEARVDDELVGTAATMTMKKPSSSVSMSA